jgi:pseudomonalisin
MTIKKGPRIAGAAALCGLMLTATGGVAHAAATTWAGTGTQAEPLGTGTVTGALSPSTPVTVTLSLALRNRAQLDRDVAAQVVGTPAEFDAEFGPTEASANAVRSYLTGAHFTGITVSANRLLVTANGTAAKAAAAFDTTLDAVSFNSRSYFANQTPAMVPSSLSGTVVAVLGLNNLPYTHADLAAPAPDCTTTTPANTLCEYEPQQLQEAYDAAGTNDGSKTPIAIFGEGDLSGVLADYAQAKAGQDLPAPPITVVVPAGDTTSTDTSSADEFDLDTQLSTGMANTVQHLYVYDASSLDDGPVALSYNAFVTPAAGQTMPAAVAGSASFGGCESLAELAGETTTDDAIFEEAAFQGQTVFASSGDTGAACEGENGVPAGVPGVEYPASSEYVVGVGGSSLTTVGTTYTYDGEEPWVGGGGGVSLFEPQGSWQAADGYAGNVPAGTGLATKTLPDLSNDADPNMSAAFVDVAGAYEGIGGTSLASPLTLGEWARMESANNNQLGFAAPVLYKLAAASSCPSVDTTLQVCAFHDIQAGTNGGGVATPGYDLATGLGTLYVGAAEAEITTLGLGTTTPPVATPETPLPVVLPIAGVALLAGGVLVMRGRRRTT